MSHEIEADYIEDYHNEDKTCIYCDSYSIKDNKCYCVELEKEVLQSAHCDFFKSID